MQNLIVDGQLKRRRFLMRITARKQWICDRCGVLINPESLYEYSWLKEKSCRLCLDCAEKLPV